jgi:preprotein translocase subunit SecA
MHGSHIDATTGQDEFAPLAMINETVVSPENRDPQNPATWGRIGRNEACPCGSGKKYKHCHGAFESNEVV